MNLGLFFLLSILGLQIMGISASIFEVSERETIWKKLYPKMFVSRYFLKPRVKPLLTIKNSPAQDEQTEEDKQ